MGTEHERDAFRWALGRALFRSRRRLSAYTQKSMGTRLEVDGDTIGRWERGKGEPGAYQLHVMATEYGVDADLLLFPTDSMKDLNERIERIRLRRAAQAAAASDEGDAPGPAAGAGRSPQPGKGPGRRPPGSKR